MMQEIERKFLVPDITKIDLLKGCTWDIETQYLVIGYEEIRIQKAVKNATDYFYYLTHKCGVGMVRVEDDIEICDLTYWTIRHLINNQPLKKSRQHLIYPYKVDVDTYLQTTLVVAEVEFPTEQEAYEFIPFSWFGEEVTNDVAYSNQWLWNDLKKTLDKEELQ
jgi:CYTH domain-containing protein